MFIGNALIVTARLNYVRKSSVEIEVKVEAEDLEKVIKFLQVLLLLYGGSSTLMDSMNSKFISPWLSSPGGTHRSTLQSPQTRPHGCSGQRPLDDAQCRSEKLR